MKIRNVTTTTSATPSAQDIPVVEQPAPTAINAPRRSTRNTTPPVWLQDYVMPTVPRANRVSVTHVHSQFQAFVTALLAQITLTSFKQAVKDKEWCLAMNEELRALELNGTWEITDLPPSKKPIDCHWIFKTKLKADGTKDRKKSRLVVNGNRQRKGVDYQETFAPVAKMVTVKALLAVAAMNNWKVCQMDVSNAFLHGDLFEDVYMKLLMGYTGVWEAVQFSKLSSALQSFGYVQSKADYSLFTKKDGD
ncbi:retrovirus-related pol polyprotein from transposon TNT 1-94 [Tanacetum coccineum]